jgi:hypothetical protein
MFPVANERSALVNMTNHREGNFEVDFSTFSKLISNLKEGNTKLNIE